MSMIVKLLLQSSDFLFWTHDVQQLHLISDKFGAKEIKVGPFSIRPLFAFFQNK